MRRSAWWWIVAGGAAMLAMAGKAVGYLVKSGVEVPTTPEMDYASEVVVQVWNEHGLTPTMTSGLDGEHIEGSFHYTGYAEDWRTHDVASPLKEQLVDEVRSRLGTNYQVFLEYPGLADEHMHIQYNPQA